MLKTWRSSNFWFFFDNINDVLIKVIWLQIFLFSAIDDIDACENNVVPNKNNILNESTQNNNIGEKNDYGEIPLGSFQNEFDQKISAPPEYHSIHKLPVININIGRTENLYPVYPVLPATH